MSETNPTPPPQPARLAGDGAATASTPETLTGIFFEPGATFDALRQRPRFLAAGLIIVACSLLVTVLLFQKVDMEKVMRDAMDKNPRAAQMSPEDKERAIAMQTGTVGKVMAYAFPLIGTAVWLAAGAALYLLGTMLMGGAMSYKQSLSVWAYSSLPPVVLGTLLSIVMLFITAPEDIDVTKPGAGLLKTNPGALLGADASAVMKSLLGSLDIFTFFGMFLAAVGLRRVARLSSGSAWGVVIAIWALGVILKVAWAASFG